jgi:hypothetical protein
MALASTFIDPSLTRPCTVHTRTAAPDKDEHGNVVYVEETYDCLVFAQQVQRQEDPMGRSSEQGYLVFFNAADVYAHAKAAGTTRSWSGQPTPTLDAFSWLEVAGIGRLEVEGDPAFPVSLRTPNHTHHVEVNARRASSQSG